MELPAHSEILNSHRDVPITLDDFYKSQKAISTFEKMGGGKEKIKKKAIKTLYYDTQYGERVTREEMYDAIKRLKISESTLRNRIIKYGWSKDEALNTPNIQGKNSGGKQKK